MGTSSKNTGDKQQPVIAIETESYIATHDFGLPDRRNSPQYEHPALPKPSCEKRVPFDRGNMFLSRRRSGQAGPALAMA